MLLFLILLLIIFSAFALILLFIGLSLLTENSPKLIGRRIWEHVRTVWAGLEEILTGLSISTPVRDKAYAGFEKLFWGMILIVIDIRLNEGQLDIMPDFIGYIMIAQGLRLLTEINPRFGRSRKLAIGLIFLSLGDLLEIKHVIYQSKVITFFYEPLWPVVLPARVINLILVWQICKGVEETAWARRNVTLATVASARGKGYVIWCGIGIMCGILLLATLSFNWPLTVAQWLLLALAVPSLVMSLVLGVQVIALMKRAGRELYGAFNNAPAPNNSFNPTPR